MSDRKTPSPKFTPERAALILAEAEFFGDVYICSKWSITRQTLFNYRNRLRHDDELFELFTLRKRILVTNWKSATVKTLQIACDRLNDIIPKATSEDVDLIRAIVGCVKSLGELNIASEALSDIDETSIAG